MASGRDSDSGSSPSVNKMATMRNFTLRISDGESDYDQNLGLLTQVSPYGTLKCLPRGLAWGGATGGFSATTRRQGTLLINVRVRRQQQAAAGSSQVIPHGARRVRNSTSRRSQQTVHKILYFKERRHQCCRLGFQRGLVLTQILC